MKEIRDKEAEKRRKLAEGTSREGAMLTVDEYFEKWIEGKRGTVKETTLFTEREWYKPISKVRVDSLGHLFGQLKLVKVEP